MKFLVLPSRWGVDDDVFDGNVEHEVAKPTKAFLRAAGAATHAGVIVIVEADDDERAAMSAHIEADDVSADALAKAQQDGRWQHGNVAGFVADRADKIAYDDSLEDGHEEKLPADTRAQVERELAAAETLLATLEEPT